MAIDTQQPEMQLQDESNGNRAPIFVFDSMRTRSHLFFRYLSTSSELYPIYHPFVLAAFLGPNRWPQKSHNTPARVEQIIQDGLNGTPSMTHANSAAALLESVRKAQKLNRVPFSGEHIFNVLREPVLHGMHRDTNMPLTQLGDNPTHIPDGVWNVLRPIIVIRHPVPHVTSGYAGVNGLGMGVGIDDEDLDILCSQRYFRHLFDHLRSQGRMPFVVDADDLLYDTMRVKDALCAALNLDPSLVSEQWSVMPEEQRPKHPVMRAFMTTFHASTGIERPDRKDEKDLNVAFGRWQDKWGDEVADRLRGIVESNLEHYSYLAQYRV